MGTNLMANCVKNIVDSTRCLFCDKLGGSRLRFSCGHSACNECVLSSDQCQLCLTPPVSSSSPVIDNLLSQQVSNAAALLDKFERYFNVNVNTLEKVSKKSRIEKELFPDCIQAPVKYFNKRKSSGVTIHNKENLKPFPGEDISGLQTKMEKSFNYVQEWLNSCNDTFRKPFSDLDTNSPVNTNHRNKSEISETKRHTVKTKSLSRKRKQNIENVPQNELLMTSGKRNSWIETKRLKCDFDDRNTVNVSNKEESGSFINDEVHVIEDTLSMKIDKDQFAIMAVIEADKNNKTDVIELISTLSSEDKKTNQDVVNSSQVSPRVPFYKKSGLLDLCEQCNKYYVEGKEKLKDPVQCNNIQINITGNDGNTIVNIVKRSTNALSSEPFVQRESKGVQTDIRDTYKLPASDLQIGPNNDENGLINSSPQSIDLFVTENLQSLHGKANEVVPVIDRQDSLIIHDSDSENGSFQGSNILHTCAEVHQSDEQITESASILCELPISTYSRPGRKVPRGHTPTSSNSSDKENRDPNRRRKSKRGKKYKKKY